MSDCQVCGVRGHSICSVLTTDERSLLGRHGRTQTVRRGQTLLWEGEDAAVVANVIDGVLKLSTATSDGREQIVGVVYPSDFIGRPFGERANYTVTALTDSRICLFARSAFDTFTREHPQLGEDLLRRTLDELDNARRWMLLLGRKSAEEKVVSFLLELSRRLGVGDAMVASPATACLLVPAPPLDRFELPVDRQQIADILGLTIETVSRQLSQLRANGLIRLPSRREVEILDREGLEALSGD